MLEPPSRGLRGACGARCSQGRTLRAAFLLGLVAAVVAIAVVVLHDVRRAGKRAAGPAVGFAGFGACARYAAYYPRASFVRAIGYVAHVEPHDGFSCFEVQEASASDWSDWLDDVSYVFFADAAFDDGSDDGRVGLEGAMAEVGARLRSGALRGLFYHNFVEGPQFVPGLPTTATSLSLVPAAGRLLAYDQHVGPKGWLGDVGKAGAFYARSHVTHPVVDSLKLMWTDAHDNAVVVGYSYGAGNVVVDTSFLSLALEGSRLADDGRAGPATEAAWVNVLDWLVSAEPEREHRCPAVVASEQVVRASGDGAFVRVALTPDSTQVPGSEHWPLSITTCSSSEGPTSGNAEDDDCRLEHGAAEVRTAREEGGPGRLYQLAWIMEIPGGGHCEGWIWVCVARTDPDDSADAAAVPGEPVCPDQADPEILWREVATAEHHHGHDHDDDA